MAEENKPSSVEEQESMLRLAKDVCDKVHTIFRVKLIVYLFEGYGDLFWYDLGREIGDLDRLWEIIDGLQEAATEIVEEEEGEDAVVYEKLPAITYRELQQKLSTLTDEQLDSTVTVYDKETSTLMSGFPMCNVGVDFVANWEERQDVVGLVGDMLEENHPVLILD